MHCEDTRPVLRPPQSKPHRLTRRMVESEAVTEGPQSRVQPSLMGMATRVTLGASSK